MLAQNPGDPLTVKSDIKLYGNLYHQHHDFFDKAFSFQGLDAGLMINRNFLLGLYGSCFVTNLKAEINNNLHFIWVSQSGINVGFYQHKGGPYARAKDQCATSSGNQEIYICVWENSYI